MSRTLKIAAIVGGILLAILLVVPLVWAGLSGARTGGWGMMGPGWGYMGPGMMGGFGWGWMPLLMIVFWGLVIWGIVAAVRYSRSESRKTSTTTESALDVLKVRYARGEIKKREYEEKKRELV
ncbi:MAG TPA: SHOCT domain-containing protein [Dehalococcoidia bacterium]|jgi:putative membrane protein